MSTWRELAACLDMDTNIFYPPQGNSVAGAQAKAICAGCPVREECLAEAIAVNDEYGIQGGKSPKERRVDRRRAIRNGQLAKSPQARTVIEGANHGTRTAYELHGCRCPACTRTQRDRKRQTAA